MYNIASRQFDYFLPTFIPQLSPYPESENSTELVLNRTERHAVFYNISIVGLDNVLQAYTAHLITRKCVASADTGRRVPIFIL